MIQTPEPVYIRVNTLKCPNRQDLFAYLKEWGFTTQPVEGLPDHYRVHHPQEPSAIARTIPHWTGWFYIQDIASGLVSQILNPQPGTTLLDLCAAPGGKTTHCAQLMHNQGTIFANDIGTRRLRALQTNLLRMGVTCCVVTRYDGLRYPDLPTPPDCVLVDAPCSGEGRIRQDPKHKKREAELHFIHQISGKQKGLLRRAITLAKKGARIVYSTCTFAPEENEFVVAYVLERMPVRLIPIHLNLPHSRGITRWENKTLPPEMEYCVRIYPHQLDSGGMFIALLEKTDHNDRT